MNIGIIGSGGREHALCVKLKESKIVDKIYCFPGNAGTSQIAENISINIDDFENIKKIALEKKIVINNPSLKGLLTLKKNFHWIMNLNKNLIRSRYLHLMLKISQG